MEYRIIVHNGNPTVADIKLLRKLTRQSMGKIKASLSGDGLSITKNYRDVLMEMEYEEWVESTIDLFTSLAKVFPEHALYYGSDSTDWETITYDYFCNFIRSSIRSWRQKHD